MRKRRESFGATPRIVCDGGVPGFLVRVGLRNEPSNCASNSAR
jgi:hypothetical protein